MSDTSAFGLSTSDTWYTVNTGGGLVFKIRRIYDSNTRKAGDIASMVYNGVEYQDITSGTQINAGMDYLYTSTSNVTVEATVVDTDHIKITATAGGMTHYYFAQRGEPRIYVATTFASEPNQTNEAFVRFIVRGLASKLPNGPAASRVFEGTSTIESADIFRTNSGETRAKHYSNQRLRDWYYIGATGDKVGMWVVRGNTEGMSGGPFYRSLLNQATGTQQQLTYIINYGEAQTEPYRMNIVNTYAVVFTDGSAPAQVDTSWYDNMGITNWVSKSRRGAVSATSMTGMDSTYTYTVGFANSAAQYWTTASSSGSFSCGGMLPGDYTMTVYKNELAVRTQSVTASAGGTTSIGTVSIAGDPSASAALWRIGDWDGSPQEMLNGDRITYMHPSDVRISTWVPGTYVVGTSVASTGFPAYAWKDINGTQTIQFTLTADQIKAYTMRIGITTAYGGGRPQIKVNSWTSSAPSASTQPDSRTMTVGTYRGNNKMYSYSVPASALVAGTNTILVNVISGSSGANWLSPGMSFDALDFVAQ